MQLKKVIKKEQTKRQARRKVLRACLSFAYQNYASVLTKRDKVDFLRAAVFLWKRPFAVALSIALTATTKLVFAAVASLLATAATTFLL